MTHLQGPAIAFGRVDLQTWAEDIKPNPNVTNDTLETAVRRAWKEAKAFDPAWCARNSFVLDRLITTSPLTEADLARIDLRPLDPPTDVAFTGLADAQGLCEADWQSVQKDAGVMPLRPLSDLDILNAAIEDRFGSFRTTAEAANAIRNSERFVSTSFPCRIGQEPMAGPAGTLVYDITVGLWRNLGLDESGEPMPRPRLRSLRFDRRNITLETREPLTLEQFQAVHAACAAFDAAVRASAPAGDTVAS